MTDNIIDIAKVSSVTIGMVTISITSVNAWLTFVSILLGMGYVARKWYLMEKNKSNGNKGNS